MSQILATWSIAMLLGGMTLFSAVVAPLVFMRLPADHAGRFIRALFPWYYLYILVCSGLATLWLALTPGREGVSWMMLLVFVTGLYARQWLMPAINAQRDAAEAGDERAAAEFKRRHAHSVWLNGAQWLAALVACALVAASPMPAVSRPASPLASNPLDCEKGSGWVDAEGVATHLGALIDAHAGKRVWLLGEQHDQASHHAWQLEVLSALYAHEPRLAMAMEMFPREAQPALDAWVAGNIDWQTLLLTSHWDEVWGFPPDLYRPLLEFARLHRIPVLAMNVHPTAARAVAQGGLEALPEALREELGQPAPPTGMYRNQLEESFSLHRSMGLGHSGHDEAAGASPAHPPGEAIGEAQVHDEDPSLARFIEAQLTWDRSMASTIAAALKGKDAPAHVVALLGGGHTGHGRGVPLQLEDLGIPDHLSLLPSAPGSACGGAEANPLQADARFVFPPESVDDLADMALPPPPRLGVALGMDVQGARVLSVEPGSLAEREGLLAGDVIVELAGRACESPGQVVEAVQRQPPGTWLPITLQRDGEARAQVIRFPSER